MAVEQVHLHQCRLQWILVDHLVEPIAELRRRGSLGLVHEEILAIDREAIVHHRVELISVVEPGLGPFPDFAGDIGVGFCSLHDLSPLDPEGVRNIAGDIQTPTINALAWITIRREPAPGDREDVFARAFPETRFGILFEDWQSAVGARLAAAIPGDVFDGGIPVANVKPIRVSAIFAILEHILKRPVASADVIEDAVEDHLEPHRVGLGDEVEEELVGLRPGPRRGIVGLGFPGFLDVSLESEVVVDVAIVGGVVLVHRIGFEHRIEIDRIDAQRPHVRQRLDQALHIPAVATLPDVPFALVKVFVAGLFAGLRLPPVGLPADEIFVRFVGGIVVRIAIAEALGEDLVPDGVFGPVGRFELRFHLDRVSRRDCGVERRHEFSAG